MFRRRARTAGRREHYRRTASAVVLSVAAFTACTGVPNDDAGDTGVAGTGGSGGAGGSAQGGAQPSGGSAGLAGGTGGSATSGAAGASGTAPGTGGSNVSGAGGSGAEPTGGTTTGGSGGSDVGGAGQTGGAGTGGAPTGGSGPGGAGSGGAAGDRCDVAVYNAATPPQIVAVSNPPSTHDPVVIEASGSLYMFHTGNNVGAKTSTNLLSWSNASALSSTPAWTNTYTARDGDLWAPDISYFGGQYHLYYSASSFGQNSSCIGHATRAALNSGSWADQGQVICTTTSNNYNAIDPNVIVDQAGAPWLSFGSFWDGIMMIPLDMMGARMGTAAPMNIAQRMATEKPVEAPFIVRRCGFYYLFVSWDKCCQGANSTYNIRVGRSTAVTGPYVDKAGLPMLNTNRQATDGGTLVVQADARWKGPGHNAIIFRGNVAYNVYHSYDANASGRITLRISEIAWDAEGWPISAGP